MKVQLMYKENIIQNEAVWYVFKNHSDWLINSYLQKDDKIQITYEVGALTPTQIYGIFTFLNYFTNVFAGNGIWDGEFNVIMDKPETKE